MSDFSAVDLRYVADNQPSLCIPRVFGNIEEPRIRHIFDELKLGKIHHIDVIERKNEKGELFKRVFVHFDKWFTNEDAVTARKRLISGKDIKIIYDNPWFWKVSANKWTPNTQPQKQFANVKPRIEFDDETTDDFGRIPRRPDIQKRHQQSSYEQRRPRPDQSSYEQRRPRPDQNSYEQRRPRTQQSSYDQRRPRPQQSSYDQRRSYKNKEQIREQPVVKSVLEPTVESVLEPTAESVLEPTAESVLEPTAESVLEPVEPFEARSPSNSPPRQRHVESNIEPTDNTIDYGTNCIPTKRSKTPKQKAEQQLIEETAVEFLNDELYKDL